MSAFALPPFEKLTDELNKLANLTETIPGMPVCWPVSGSVTQGMSIGSHTGIISNSIDIGGNNGATVLATHDGTVIEAGWNNSGYGNVVKISGRTENSLTFVTVYAHLQSIQANAGSVVKKGQAIGTVDTTGNSDGPHLHYGIEPGFPAPILDTIKLSGCISQTDADRIKNCEGRDNCNYTISQTVQP
jgi:murein DD-endopeptidase MepM/ murein hydrolase activator NlpD